MCLGCKKWAYPTLHFADEATIPSHRLPSCTRSNPSRKSVWCLPNPSPKVVPFAGFPSRLLPAESPQGSIGPAFPVDLQLLGSMIHGSFGVPHVTSGWGGKSLSLRFYRLQESALCSISCSPHMPYAFTGQQKQFRTTHTSKGDSPSQRPAKPGEPQWFSESSSRSQQVAGFKTCQNLIPRC